MNTKKNGIALILIGIFIPLVIYPFTSLSDEAEFNRAIANSRGASYSTRINDLIIVTDERGTGYSKRREGIEYKYFFSSGVILIFVGISVTIFPLIPKNPKRGSGEEASGKTNEKSRLLSKKYLKNLSIALIAILSIVAFSYFVFTYDKSASSPDFSDQSLGYFKWVIKGAVVIFFAAVYAGLRGKK